MWTSFIVPSSNSNLIAENTNDLVCDDEIIVLLQVTQRILKVITLYMHVGLSEQVLVEHLLLERGDLALIFDEFLESLRDFVAMTSLFAAVAGGQDAYIDAARFGIHSGLLEGLAMQSLAFLHVAHVHKIAES